MPDSGVNIIQDPYAVGQPGQGGSPNAQTGASPVAPTDPGAAPGGAAAGGGGSSSGAPQAPSGGGASTSKTGTGFVNIQNVLNANKGTGAQLGNTIGSGITQQATNVGQQLGQAQQTFGAAAQAGTVGSAADQSAVQNILGGIQGYQAPSVNTVGSGSTSTTPSDTTQTQTAGAAPANGANGFPTTQNSIANPWSQAQILAYQGSNPNPAAGQNLSTPLDAGLTAGNVSQFGQLLAGQYTGPTELSGIDNLNQQAQQVAALGQNIGTSGGQQQLLQQFVGGNNANYGAGAQGLDQLLLGQGGAQPLQQAAAGTALLPGQVASAQAAAENQAALDQASSNQFGANLKNQLGSLQSGILAQGTQASQNATTADQATQNNYTTIQNLLNGTTGSTTTGASGTPSASDLTNAQQAVQDLQSNGQLTSAQATQLNTLLSKGYINPNSTANASYEAAQNNPNGQSTVVDPSNPTKYLTNQQALTAGLITNPAASSEPGWNPNSEYLAPTGPGMTPQGVANGSNYLTNQQALANGSINPSYTSLSAAGVDPSTLLLNNYTNTQAQGNTAGAFLTPSQQAQLNAISQLQGQNQNSNTQNLPQYQAASNNFNFDNLMSQLGSNSTLNASPAAVAQAASSSGGGNGNPLLALNPVTAPLAVLPSFSAPSFNWAHGGLVTEDHVKFNKLSQMFKK